MIYSLVYFVMRLIQIIKKKILILLFILLHLYGVAITRLAAGCTPLLWPKLLLLPVLWAALKLKIDRSCYYFCSGVTNGRRNPLIFQIAVLVARTWKLKSLPSNPFVVVVSPDQLESLTLKLKTVKRKLELFDSDDKLKELENWMKSFIFVTCFEHRVMAQSLSRGTCSIYPFSTHGRSLFSTVSEHQKKSLC